MRVALLIALVFAASQVQAETTEAACRSLVLDYAYYRDRPDADAFANLFAEDGTLVVLGEEYASREKIRARLQGAAAGPVFRHMMSTIRIFPRDEDHADGVSYVTVYTAPPGDGPMPVQGFAAIGEYHDQFVRTPAGWKIQRREFKLVFTPLTAD